MNLLIARSVRLRRAKREGRPARTIASAPRVVVPPARAARPAAVAKPEVAKQADQVPELFKFYEEAAEKAKAQAWAQTSWLLALNAGIIAFSLNLFAIYGTAAHFLLVEAIAAGVGVVLCVFLIYLLAQLGGHISHYWTTSNKLASGYPPLAAFLSAADLAAVRTGRPAPFPAFCRRLQLLAALFAAAHVGWLGLVASF